jgi:hypothetical protein
MKKEGGEGFVVGSDFDNLMTFHKVYVALGSNEGNYSGD